MQALRDACVCVYVRVTGTFTCFNDEYGTGAVSPPNECVCTHVCVVSPGAKGGCVLRDPQPGIYLSLCTHTQTHTITDSAQD